MPTSTSTLQAIFNFGEYRLSREFRSLSVSPHVWNQKNDKQKEVLLARILGISDVTRLDPDVLAEEMGRANVERKKLSMPFAGIYYTCLTFHSKSLGYTYHKYLTKQYQYRLVPRHPI